MGAVERGCGCGAEGGAASVQALCPPPTPTREKAQGPPPCPGRPAQTPRACRPACMGAREGPGAVTPRTPRATRQARSRRGRPAGARARPRWQRGVRSVYVRVRAHQVVVLVQRKNCEPLVLGPALAMDSTPGPVWRSVKFSSAGGGWGGEPWLVGVTWRLARLRKAVWELLGARRGTFCQTGSGTQVTESNTGKRGRPQPQWRCPGSHQRRPRLGGGGGPHPGSARRRWTCRRCRCRA